MVSGIGVSFQDERWRIHVWVGCKWKKGKRSSRQVGLFSRAFPVVEFGRSKNTANFYLICIAWIHESVVIPSSVFANIFKSHVMNLRAYYCGITAFPHIFRGHNTKQSCAHYALKSSRQSLVLVGFSIMKVLSGHLFISRPQYKNQKKLLSSASGLS